MTSAGQSHPVRHTGELHRGRISIPGARYFVTIVTRNRERWLLDPAAARAVLNAFREWHDERDGALICATVMPNHVHAVFELGQQLTVGQCCARWKTAVRRALAYTHEWQRDYFEHRLRSDELLEDYGLYCFLNPYRSRLIDADVAWPFWLLPDPEKLRFSTLLTSSNTPPREWLGWSEDRFAHLTLSA
jgi:putative transposase